MTLSFMLSNLVICILGVALNACQIVSLVYTKRTKLPFDITLISLAASDLLFAATSVLSTIIPFFIPSTLTWTWYFKLSVLCIYTSSLSSALHMVFIAIQRLIAVLYPLKLAIWMTRRRCIKITCFLWLVSIAVSAPVSIHYYAFQKFLMYSPLISASFIVVCYVIINIKMLTRKRLAVSGQPSENIHILVYSICITAIFMICTFPYTIYVILHPDDALNPTKPWYTVSLFYLQVILDPVVYFFSHILMKNRCIVCSRSCQCCRSTTNCEQQEN